VSATTEKSAVLELRRHLGEVFHKLTEQKENRIEEGHLLPYRVHMMTAILPKYAVSQVIGFIKGKSAIHLSGCMGRKKNSCGSTSGRTDITHPWWGEMRLSSVNITSAGSRGKTIGPNQAVELTAAEWWPNFRGRITDPNQPLAAAHNLKPQHWRGILPWGPDDAKRLWSCQLSQSALKCLSANDHRLLFFASWYSAVVIDDSVAAVGEVGVKTGQGVPSRFNIGLRRAASVLSE
jgi:hypothetical protein